MMVTVFKKQGYWMEKRLSTDKYVTYSIVIATQKQGYPHQGIG
jgi:hypothetical protein